LDRWVEGVDPNARGLRLSVVALDGVGEGHDVRLVGGQRLDEATAERPRRPRRRGRQLGGLRLGVVDLLEVVVEVLAELGSRDLRVHLPQIADRDAVLDVLGLVLGVRVLLLDQRLDELGPLRADLGCAVREEDAEHRHGDANVGAQLGVGLMVGLRPVPLFVLVAGVRDVFCMLERIIHALSPSWPRPIARGKETVSGQRCPPCQVPTH
jgi:hypothetical protein